MADPVLRVRPFVEEYRAKVKVGKKPLHEKVATENAQINLRLFFLRMHVLKSFRKSTRKYRLWSPHLKRRLHELKRKLHELKLSLRELGKSWWVTVVIRRRLE